jgi:hypothetical protein
MSSGYDDLKEMDSRFRMKSSPRKTRIAWLSERKKSFSLFGKKAKRKGKKLWMKKGAAARSAFRGSVAAAQGIGKAGERWGYALPSPFQIWTLAWQKTGKALKTLAILVFALVLLFIPWGVFYYTAWGVASAFMFLISLIYWVFVNLFNGIAYGLVAIINGIASIFLGLIVAVVEAIFGVLGLGQWANGRYLLSNSLISYDQIANVPSLYHIVTPAWQPWMNDTIIGHVLHLLGIPLNFSMFSDQFRAFYLGLSPDQAVILGLIIIMIPIVYLAVVYYRNRYHFAAYG